MNYNLFTAYKITNTSARSLYQNYIDDGLFKTREDLVLLSKVFNDQLTSTLYNFEGKVVKSVNGIEISSLKQLHDILEKDDLPKYLEIYFEGSKKPLILPSDQLEDAHKRLSNKLGITHNANLSLN